MRRQFLVLTVLLTAALLLAACGGAATPAPAESTAPATGVAATQPAVEPTEAATAVPLTDAPTEAPATEAPSPTAEPTAEPTAAEPTPAASGEDPCPAADAGTYLLRNPQHGYCLLYPITHKVERPNPDEVDLVIGGLLNATDPRAGITVEDAAGRTAAEIADQVIADNPGFEIDRMEVQVGGADAILLAGLPGQDINRQAWFVHEDRLYHITFSPDQVTPGEIRDRLTALVDTVLNSFTFIPVSDTATAADECLQPKDNEQLATSEAFGYCFLIPAEFTYEEASETNANVYFGSMMDVEHPKLMIEVTDAGDQTAAGVADAIVAEFPDLGIERSFGDTLGYEPAERLDGVPGQDLGRVLLVVRGDKLYRLTFVPSDPLQPEANPATDALFDKVLQSFRFLPEQP